ncbi:MAG: bifunctional methylenetetrahydrofolate dehydrogenase/methenyltetrahydrofolate cyclohydrolase [Gammaproteobacteria bacterium RIFCSPHIGHO2_12_FULL_41_15]|nr:MAG: bifunctional methylenetetrahydrofolate dehydrogenase/methenyltetrahydrofolate cyclohydrolase [Gammaproteobacteria bacterium RIFCSPHIGHO2_12_FULL_41_15]
MTAQLLDGRALSQRMKTHIAQRVQQRLSQRLPAPGLAVILVGDDPASHTYVSHKQRACQEVSIHSHIHRLPSSLSQETLVQLIDQCNQDPKTHGILLQLPLPSHIATDDLLERINPQKDVDGFHPYNMGRLAQRRPLLRPCTPYGIIRLLEQTDRPIAGQHAVVVGASNIVGRPMALELLLAKATVTICHRSTISLSNHVKEADILIAAIGNPGVIQSTWIKPGAIVVDVGFSRLTNGKITGDIEFDTAKTRASWITPVPGGVGPMTVATLLENTLQAAENQDFTSAF